MELDEKAREILEAIAEGHSYEQILARQPKLTFNDIFHAAAEALECIDRPNQGKSFSLEAIQLKYPRAYEKWSMEEDTELAELYRGGVEPVVIATKFQRQPSAIRSRLVKLSLVALRV